MRFQRATAALTAVFLGLLPAFAGTTLPAPASALRPDAGAGQRAGACAQLVRLQLPHASIALAQVISGGTFTPPGATVPLVGLPEFCRVAGVSTPTSDSLIGFEVWIPTGTRWNAKYQQAGNGGFAGAIPYASLAAGLALGYAVAGTDDGHIAGGLDATWALGHPQKIVDYGYRALKETTDKAKAIIEAFTGLRPSRSYFSGCSDGGREALMEAERFPDDFDGIIVGSPANFITRLFTSFIWDEQALLDHSASYIPAAELPLLTNAALASCAGKDGGLVSDGFLNDPRGCRFDPSVVQCKAHQNHSTCLTGAQVAAAKKIYDGMHDTRTHALLFPGFEPGSEASLADWPAWVTGTAPGTSVQFGFGQQYFANFVFANPSWDIRTLNFTSDVVLGDEYAPVLNSTNPDLRRFIGHGGKIIHYVGWADSAIQPKNSLNYYDSVLLALGAELSGPSGSLSRLQSSYRMFMVPGMAHCSGGPGANAFGNVGSPSVAALNDPEHNVALALDRWVEHGVAPERIVATKFVDDTAAAGIAFQRPLCPYPSRSQYRGAGDPRSARNFACVTDRPAFAADIARSLQYLISNRAVLLNPRE